MQGIKDGQLLPIHFDLPRHVIPLRTFVETTENAGRIVEVINQELFGGAFVLEIVVMPPEEGTFLSRLGITVKSVSAVALVAILSGPLGDFGSGMFQELISKSATDVGKDVVSSIRSSMEQLQSYSEDKEVLCGAASTITVAAVKWFLQEDNEEIDTLPFAPALTEALIAKRKFYDACREVPDLQGIGFSRSPTFPIKRSDFQRISKLPESADGDDWIVTIENITGDSPQLASTRQVEKLEGHRSGRAFPLLHHPRREVLGNGFPARALDPDRGQHEGTVGLRARGQGAEEAHSLEGLGIQRDENLASHV